MGGGITSPGHERPKPRLRGRLHEVRVLRRPSRRGSSLVLSASGPRRWSPRRSTGSRSRSQFGVSAAYHLGMWSEVGRERMRTLDHATIFVPIAGTYTPFCLLVLARRGRHRRARDRLDWRRGRDRDEGLPGRPARRCPGSCISGWGGSPSSCSPPSCASLTTIELALMVAGGLLYSGGALVLALHRPNPWPRTFGYHEVWHCRHDRRRGVSHTRPILRCSCLRETFRPLDHLRRSL